MTDAPGFTTRSIHASAAADTDAFGSVVAPLYLSSTFAMESPGVMRGPYDYARAGNPNRTALEDTLAGLEGADFCAAVASGMAAETAVLSALLSPGDTLVLPRDVYGGTVRLAEDEYARWGVRIVTVDTTDDADLDRVLADGAALVWIETPSNPCLDVLDIESIAARTHAAGALLVVDSTFASPYVQRPLELGADVVLHSTTKFIGGHSDVIGGAVLLRTDSPRTSDAAVRIERRIFNAGVGQAPFDTWLTLRGVKTLALRMERHCANALAVARWLEGRPGVAEVYYPGLESHPRHELAHRQMNGFGGVVSFRADSPELATEICRNTRVFTLAESLGGVESLIDHPASMTHRVLADTELAVDPAVIRLAIGLEDEADLLADLADGLQAGLESTIGRL